MATTVRLVTASETVSKVLGRDLGNGIEMSNRLDSTKESLRDNNLSDSFTAGIVNSRNTEFGGRY